MIRILINLLKVQVIIPYTSDYTPIPFQQSHGDWSTKTNFERTVARRVPPRNGLNVDNYVQQESRNDIRVINQLQSQFNINQSSKLNSQTPRPNAIENVKTTTKANNSIDVRRLQKNIDNWTIQVTEIVKTYVRLLFIVYWEKYFINSFSTLSPYFQCHEISFLLKLIIFQASCV